MTERSLVRDLMTVGVTTCSPDTPIVEVTRLLLERDLEGVVVLDLEGHAVGVVSRDELVRAYARDDCRDLTAEEVMRDGVPQIPPDIPLTAAAQLMQDLGVRVVFLMHHAGGIEWPAATLSYKHLLRHLAAQEEDELSDLGIAAARQTPLETFIQKRDDARRQTRRPTQE
jgi:predicted transcriptional regulator